MEILLSVLSVGVVVGILDFFWLGFIAKKLYAKEIGHLLAAKVNGIAAALFYVIYTLGVTFIVVMPYLYSDILVATAFGAAFGFVAYATYDLTNLSTLKNFSRKIVVIDMLWGTFITASAVTVAHLVANTFA